MKWVVAAALFLAPLQAHAYCQVVDIDDKQARTVVHDIDNSRSNLMALADLADPVDKLSIRIAHDDVELVITYHAMVTRLIMLHFQVKTAADRAAVDAVFADFSAATMRTAHSAADYLTAMAATTQAEAVRRETLALRDKVRELESLYKSCGPSQ